MTQEGLVSNRVAGGATPPSRSILLLKAVTPAQRRAGNYRKGHIKFQGLNISIEHRRGSVRRGVAKDGKAWAVTMQHPYGYIRRSEGTDGEHVDCFVGPHEDASHVYVVHQHKIEKVRAWPGDVCPQCLEPHEKCWHDLDEDKCMMGFHAEADAKQAYLANYDDRRFLGPVTAVPIEDFKTKVHKTLEQPGMIKARHPMGTPLFLLKSTPAAERKTVAVDFDGPLHKGGFRGVGMCDGEPAKGAREGVAALRKGYNVQVHSFRAGIPAGKRAIEQWLGKHGIAVDGITSHIHAGAVHISQQFGDDWNGIVGHVQVAYPPAQPWEVAQPEPMEPPDVGGIQDKAYDGPAISIRENVQEVKVKGAPLAKSDKLSASDREQIGTVGSKHREDEPEGVFLEPGSRKYPVKEKHEGAWKYSRKLLEAAASEARMHGHADIASRADKILADLK